MSCGLLLLRSILIVALWFAALIDSSPVNPQKLVPRVTLQDLAKIKGAVLTKDGKQLSCGVGLLDNKASLVSADCLDYKDGSVDTNVKYKIYTDSGFDGATDQLDVMKITVHPAYNKESKANNVALLEYNLSSNVTWRNYNSINRSIWDNVIYAQRVLTDIETGSWGTAKMYVHSLDSDAICSDLSPIFKANQDEFTCNEVVAETPLSKLSSCKIPYGTLYGVTNNIVHQAGFFSHAVVKSGSDLCKYNTVRTYYTLIGDYLTWVRSVTGRTYYYFKPSEDSLMKAPAGANFKMNDVPSAATKDAAVVSGNLFSLEANEDLSSSESNTDASTANSENNGNSVSASGLSTKNTIIVAVCCTVGTLLVVVGLYFLIRWYRGNLSKTRDPYSSARVQDLLTNDIGGASLPHQQHQNNTFPDIPYDRPPPAYREGNQRPANNIEAVVDAPETLLHEHVLPDNIHHDKKD
ncbi:hypothetical protein H4S08_004817 [Coemansia sp. RSA 1365]|nr:hypothetical protein H4S08_004817 [Coemansia sp. RSA 1365]